MGVPIKFMEMRFVCDEGGKNMAECDGKCIENQVICIHLTIEEVQAYNKKKKE